MYSFNANRRGFLKTIGQAGATAAAWAGANSVAAGQGRQAAVPLTPATPWTDVRQLFELRPDRVHMAGMVIASHPAPVVQAIELHRNELQRDPVRYIDENRWRLEAETLRAASHYLGVAAADIALTDSTSMGLSLLYTGLRLAPRDEILTTTHDHYSTETAIAECAERTGCSVRRIAMYKDLATATADQLVEAIRDAVSDKTRVVALTWVHSGTGLKVPVRRIADAVRQLNGARNEDRRIYLCVDAVHALGIENFRLPELDCDFWAAGTHKWLFGPRGTGVLWGRADAWNITRPTIATWEPAAFPLGSAGSPSRRLVAVSS